MDASPTQLGLARPAHDERIEASNSPGVGTTTTMLVEWIDSHRARVVASSDPALIGTEIGPITDGSFPGADAIDADYPFMPPTRRTALVIDDEPAVCEYYTALLEELDWNAVTATTGGEGIRRFEYAAPDLAIVDVRLPDMNGYDVCRSLRTSDPANTRIILASADPAMVIPERANSAGADLALVGPIGVGQLRKILAAQPTPAPRRPSVTTPRAHPAPAPAPTGLRIQLFGTPRIVSDTAACDIPAGMATDIISILAIHHPAQVTTSELASLVWADSPVRSGTVHTAVSRLRTTLTRAGLDDVITTSGGGYALNTSADLVDTLSFERQSRDLSTSLPIEEYLQRAQALLAIDLTHSFGTSTLPVVEAARTRMNERRATLEERTAVRLLVSGRTAPAIEIARDLTARELWRESAWMVLATALYGAGRQRDAIEALQLCRRTLINAVGVEPCPRLREIERLVLSQDTQLNDAEYLIELAS